ncbi:MAG TPA: LssY C-terminal domain-containing protein [Candidatus Sulfotelmatobacter sp.]|nr:LssY C-terminal domain-containing protein [Candidatus Sulfotelmatobacter sp.]
MKTRRTQKLITATLAVLALTLGALAWRPRTSPDTSGGLVFIQRAVAHEQNGVKVSVSVPTDEESKRFFGGPLAGFGAQAVWIKIENGTDASLYYLPITADPNYFSPLEAAQRLHRWFSSGVNSEIDGNLERQSMPTIVAAHQSASGFVYTHRDSGLKLLNVGVLAGNGHEQFRFILPVEGRKYAMQNVNLEKLYAPGHVEELDLAGLRKKLETLPCCVTNKDGSRNGDPLNLVIVGNGIDAIFPFTGRGWKMNESADVKGSYQMVKALLFRSEYDTAPVSPLYLFGRVQDVALEKARETINERNHLRLWMAPFRVEGQEVWVGHISRDIGLHFTTKAWYLLTHRMDEQVDLDRTYLLQDLIMSGYVERFGYVIGVGASAPDQPRTNMTNDPYVTDGLRVVIFLGPKLVPIEQVQRLDWEMPFGISR